jgi:hypothetical protein
MADDNDTVVVPIGGQPPEQRLGAQRREERRRRLRQKKLVDLPFRARGGRTGAVQPDVFEPGDALAVFEVQFIRNAELLWLIGSGRGSADMDEPIRLRERQRLEEHGIDDAEDRDVRSDGERERRHDDEREARRAGKTPRRVREVPDPSFQHCLPPFSEGLRPSDPYTRCNGRLRDASDRLLCFRGFRGVDFGVTAHDAVALACHVALQTSLDDRQRELEQRPVWLLDFERGLAGGDGALLDLPLLVSRACCAGELLARLRQVEHDRSRIAFCAVRALHLECAFPFACEAGGGLGCNGRRERGEYQCESDKSFHGRLIALYATESFRLVGTDGAPSVPSRPAAGAGSGGA